MLYQWATFSPLPPYDLQSMGQASVEDPGNRIRDFGLILTGKFLIILPQNCCSFQNIPFFSSFFLSCIYLCGTCSPRHKCGDCRTHTHRSHGNYRTHGSRFSLSTVWLPRNWTQMIRLSSDHLYPFVHFLYIVFPLFLFYVYAHFASMYVYPCRPTEGGRFPHLGLREVTDVSHHVSAGSESRSSGRRASDRHHWTIFPASTFLFIQCMLLGGVGWGGYRYTWMQRDRRHWNPQELELQVVMKHLAWALGTELESSAKELSTRAPRSHLSSSQIVYILSRISYHIFSENPSISWGRFSNVLASRQAWPPLPKCASF